MIVLYTCVSCVLHLGDLVCRVQLTHRRSDHRSL